MSSPSPSPRRSRRAPLALAVVAAAALALVALFATGRLNARLLPSEPAQPAPSSVQCFGTDDELLSGWSARVSGGATPSERVDPRAICAALSRDRSATATMDRIATQQQALGHGCVVFDTADGEHWALTGLATSSNGTYTASGGPAPGRLPDFGEVEQPAPLVSLAPLPASTSGCVRLPTVTWNLAVPPFAACTSDGSAVSVYVRSGHQSAGALCAAKGLVVADD